MSIKTISEVWKYSKNGGSLLLVELAIADHINSEGLAWPSVKHLALKTKLSERQVHRVIKQLEKSGELIILRDRRYNRYRLNLIGDNMSVGDKMSSNEMHGIKDIQETRDDIINTSNDNQSVIGDTQESITDTGDTLISNNPYISKKETLLNVQKSEFNSMVIDKFSESQKSNYDPEAETVWLKLLEVVEREYPRFYRQLANYSKVSFQGEILRVFVLDTYTKEYLNDRIALIISRLIVGIMNKKCLVTFEVDQSDRKKD
jgi:AraC-like DNA-binding protein